MIQRRYKKGSRWIYSLSIVLFIVICTFTGKAYALPDINARAYTLIEASTGRILVESNASETLPMASTTKVMACILAIENGNLDAIVQVPDEAVGIEGSSIYLQYGETISLHDLLYGLMLASGNDAAVAIAVHIAGSVDEFAEMMNQKAKEIGALHTHFVTPNGLPDENHYTTAHDLALISAYAMQNEIFREIVGTASMNLAQDDDSPARYLRSKNKMLYAYDGGNGIKTGYTKAAGKCLTAGAYRDDMQLIAVVLNDPDMFEDCYDLLDYGFENYSMQIVATKQEELGTIKVENGVLDKVEIVLNEDIALPLKPEEYTMIEKKVNLVSELQAPIYAGMPVGSMEFWLEGTLYALADIVAAQDILENTYEFNLLKIIEQWVG